METRLIIAYMLIALMVAALVGIYLYVTRERRSMQRASKRSQVERKKRLADL